MRLGLISLAALALVGCDNFGSSSGPILVGYGYAGGYAAGGSPYGGDPMALAGSSSGGAAAGGEPGQASGGASAEDAASCEETLARCLETVSVCYAHAAGSHCEPIVDICASIQRKCTCNSVCE
jgi:hypothetical protein